jgi:hypothetical protein
LRNTTEIANMVIIASIGPAVVITSAGALGHDLVGRNLKARQRIWPEGGDDRHIRGVPTASHEHPSDAWRITHQSAIKTTFLLYSAGSSARTAA